MNGRDFRGVMGGRRYHLLVFALLLVAAGCCSLSGFGSAQGGGSGLGSAQGSGSDGLGSAQGSGSDGLGSAQLADAIAGVDGMLFVFNASESPSTITVTSSPDVDSWADSGANSYDLAQVVAAAKPHSVDGAGGFDAVQFDGTDDVLSVTTTFTTDHHISHIHGSCWIVFDTRSNDAGVMFNLGTNNNSSTYWLVQDFTYGGNHIVYFAIREGGMSPDSFYTSTTTLTDDTVYLLEIHTNSAGNGHDVLINGVAQTLTDYPGYLASTGQWISNATPAGYEVIQMGANINGSSPNASFCDNEVSFVAMRAATTTTSDEDRSAMRSALAARFGVTLP